MIKILVIDDEIDVCDFTMGFFKDRGFEASCAESGEEGLKMAKEKNPDIVLLDIKMKGMDGITTLKRIKEVSPSVAVIMVTAVADVEKMEEAMTSGAKDYITKPLVLEDLEKKIAAIASELKKDRV